MDSVTRIDPTGWLIERTTHATITEAGVAADRGRGGGGWAMRGG